MPMPAYFKTQRRSSTRRKGTSSIEKGVPQPRFCSVIGGQAANFTFAGRPFDLPNGCQPRAIVVAHYSHYFPAICRTVTVVWMFVDAVEGGNG